MYPCLSHLLLPPVAIDEETAAIELQSLRGAGIVTGLDTGGDGGRERPAQKPSMVITLRKSPQFDDLLAATQARQQSEGRHGFFGGREGADDGDGSDDDEPPQIPARRIVGEGSGSGAGQGGAGGAGPSRGGGGAPGPSRA